MRTTLTLEADVAAQLKRTMKARRQSLKDTVNDALRLGLATLGRQSAQAERFIVKPFNLGPSLVGSLDNIEEVLSRVEGEDHK